MADLFTNAGIANTVTALTTQGTDKYLTWGTGTGATASSAGPVTPAAPTTTTAVTGTQSAVTTTVTGDTLQVVGTITASGTVAITEVGLGTSATAATAMTQYHSFAAINLVSGDSIAFTIKRKYS